MGRARTSTLRVARYPPSSEGGYFVTPKLLRVGAAPPMVTPMPATEYVPPVVAVGPPTGECAGCGRRYRMTDKLFPAPREFPWELPEHTGNRLGAWGYCTGMGQDAEDVR